MVLLSATSSYNGVMCTEANSSSVDEVKLTHHSYFKKNKLSQKLNLEKDQTSPSDHQEIIEKYDKLKVCIILAS